MVRGIFITATGTDVGKTYVSALLVKKMRDLGYNCGYFKPVLSGAEIVDGKLVPGDCRYVLNFAGIDVEPMECVSYAFQPALSPHLASEIENVSIKLDKIVSDFKRVSSWYDFVVVEGAGGIVCPFNLRDGETLLLPDVIRALGLDIFIVANAELGTINSTVLTYEYAKQKNINISGIILNNYNQNDLMQKDNLEQIQNLTGIDVVGTVKRNQSDIDIFNLPEYFKEI